MKFKLLSAGLFAGGIMIGITSLSIQTTADTDSSKSKSKDSASSTNAAPASAKVSSSSKTGKDAKPETKSDKKLTGQELYAMNCNRCHSERYPTEFNSGQWKTLVTHMRVRANLPADQVKEILKYLQEDSGR